MNRSLLITATTGILIAFAGCKEASTEHASATATPEQQTSPNTWLLTSAPDGAVSISEARANSKEGDTVVIRGRIGGRHSPISDGSPVFTIVDLAIPYCGQHSDDGCSTPWDYCCETSETLVGNSATVQVIADGGVNPITAGLEALDEVVLIGTVGPRPTEEVLTVRASGVYLAGG